MLGSGVAVHAFHTPQITILTGRRRRHLRGAASTQVLLASRAPSRPHLLTFIHPLPPQLINPSSCAKAQAPPQSSQPAFVRSVRCSVVASSKWSKRLTGTPTLPPPATHRCRTFTFSSPELPPPQPTPLEPIRRCLPELLPCARRLWDSNLCRGLSRGRAPGR